MASKKGKKINNNVNMANRVDISEKMSLAIAICIAIFMMIVAVIVSVDTINRSVYSEREEYLGRITEVSSKTINESIRNQHEQALVAKTMVENSIHRSEVTGDFASRLAKQMGVDENLFFFVDSNGRYYCSDGATGKIKETEYYNAKAKKEEKHIATLPHLDSTKTYLIHSFRLEDPFSYISKGEKVQIEYFASMHRLNKMGIAVASTFEGTNNTFLYLSDSGETLYRQFDEGHIQTGSSIYPHFFHTEIVHGDSPKRCIERCKARETIVVEMDNEDGEYYFCSAPLEEKNWSMAVVIKKNQIYETTGSSFNDIIAAVIIFGILMGLTILVVAGMIMKILSNKRTQEALEQVNAAKTSFLFNMSHDIRTPLNAIIGFTNIALKNIEDKDKVENSLKKTRLSGEILLGLINDILEFSRIESGNIALSRAKADIVDMLKEAHMVLADTAEEHGIDLILETGEIKDRKVWIDEARCQSIFLNVLSNGIKYTHSGGWVKIRLEQIEPDKPKNEGAGEGLYEEALYKVTIEDNGIGMSEEFQKHLFEEFAREENSTTSGIQGTGLGLALCKSIAELMGGTIECESKQGEGSRFIITLPVELQSPEEIESNAEALAAEKAALDGAVALVVEDLDLNMEIARDILRDMGVSVEEAENGEIAVDMVVEKGINHYDFILMDIQMPIMDGYEATREIRRLFPENKVPIIALSANAFEEDKQKSIEAGMTAHIAKPINIEELRAVLAEHKK